MSSSAAAPKAPRALRLPAWGRRFRPAVPPLAVAAPALQVVGISGDDDPAHRHRIALPSGDPCGFRVFSAPDVGIDALRLDLAREAEAELRL